MYIKRDIEDYLLKVSKQFKVVTILGPRQSGKTTLAKHIFPNYTYVNMEKYDAYSLAKRDINEFFKVYKSPLIIDEIQRVPELLNEIQSIVDEKEEFAQFILTGSFQQELKSGIAQSLAGRTAVLSLLPLSIKELKESGISIERDELIYKGFMPRIYSDNVDATVLQSAYYQTYVERDMQVLLNVKNKMLFDKFMHILAGRIGSLLNYESLSNDVGVSKNTIVEWISILESSYLIYLVYPYFGNYTKRMIKSPKIFFCDIGLVSYLLGIDNPSMVMRDPLFGSLFENMVINEIVKNQLNSGKEININFLRDSKGFEIDVILPKRLSVLPVEVKASSTQNKDFEKNIRTYCKMINADIEGAVVYSGEQENTVQGIRYINFANVDLLVN